MNTNPALDIDSVDSNLFRNLRFIFERRKSQFLHVLYTQNTYFQGDQKFWKIVFTRG